MTFKISDFLRFRPYLYHLTSERNIRFLEMQKGLHSALTLFQKGQRPDLLHLRRHHSYQIVVDGVGIDIRDQKPLHFGNVEFEAGWNGAAFIAHLNSHIFFWPGTEKGPKGSGPSYFNKYRDEDTLIFKFYARDLFLENSPLFSRFNSGAPRCSNGHKSPRGASTFLPANEIDTTVSGVVEVAFNSFVPFPQIFEVSLDNGKSWRQISRNQFSNDSVRRPNKAN